MKDLSRRSFVKKSVAGTLVAANLTTLIGIVSADGGGGTTGSTTGTTAINPCVYGTRTQAECQVSFSGGTWTVDKCVYNGTNYYCLSGDQIESTIANNDCRANPQVCSPILP